MFGAHPTVRCFFLSAFLALAGFLAACRSPQERVGERLGDLRLFWQTNLVRQTNLPNRELTWAAAAAKLRANNLKLRQSYNDVVNSREAVRQIFRDLIPTLNLRTGVAKKLNDISNVNFDDVTFSADSFFNVPGLVSFGARLYVSRLMQLRAETAYRLTQREQFITLYKLFWAAQDNQTQQDHLANQRTTANAMEEVDPFTGKLMITELDLKTLTLARDNEAIQQQAGEILGDRTYHWIFRTNDLPDLAYDTQALPLSDTNRVAQLQLKLGAIELEAERAELIGIRLRYWPELNIFVSGPPIYQRALGTDKFWDPGEVRASADLFWYIDTRGYIRRQVRQAKRQHAIQRERLQLENVSLIERLVFTQELLRHTTEKWRQINAQIEVLRQVPPVQNYLSLQKYAADYQFLADQQRDLRRQIAELNTLFWFVDETAWPDDLAAPTPLAQNAVTHALH